MRLQSGLCLGPRWGSSLRSPPPSRPPLSAPAAPQLSRLQRSPVGDPPLFFLTNRTLVEAPIIFAHRSLQLLYLETLHCAVSQRSKVVPVATVGRGVSGNTRPTFGRGDTALHFTCLLFVFDSINIQW